MIEILSFEFYDLFLGRSDAELQRCFDPSSGELLLQTAAERVILTGAPHTGWDGVVFSFTPVSVFTLNSTGWPAGDILSFTVAGPDGAIWAVVQGQPLSFQTLFSEPGLLFAGDDTLLGHDGLDFLAGGDGADLIIGRGGADYMVGGRGDDVYEVTDREDLVVEAAGEGQDRIYSRLASYALPEHAEELFVLNAGAVGFGNAQNNLLVGDDGAQVLIGAGGADVMAGGRGDDIYEVTEAGDFVLEWAGEGVDRVYSRIGTYTLGAHVEELVVLNPGAVGFGNAGNNSLFGDAGTQVLIGGAGDDLMMGGAGDDVYEVTETGDVVAEQADSGRDRVYSRISSYGLGENIEELVVLNDNAVGFGNSGDNLLVGDVGLQVLIGAAGDDVMIGGPGDDIYEVTEAGDVVIELAGQGADRVYSRLEVYTLGQNVEELIVLNAGGTGIGNALNNLLVGDAGAQILIGGAGADILNGAAGDDRLEGGTGRDTFVWAGPSAGHDRITDFSTIDDLIVLDGALFGNFDAVRARAAQVGASVVIAHESGISLTLDDLLLASLSADDFAFIS